MIDVIIHGCNGRMGRVLAELIQQQPEMQVVAGVDLFDRQLEFPVYKALSDCPAPAHVLIDFSNRESLRTFLPTCIDRKLPLVIATTGLDQDDIASLEQASQTIPIFRSANMSQGINLLQQLIMKTTRVLGDAFDIEIIERHHNMKKDAPSGTALMLARSVNEANDQRLTLINGREGTDCKREALEVGLHAVRGGTVVGDHEVQFLGKDEEITLSHRATSRQIFATGAIAAARYLSGKGPGMYDMHDLINAQTGQTSAAAELFEATLLTLSSSFQEIDGLREIVHGISATNLSVRYDPYRKSFTLLIPGQYAQDGILNHLRLSEIGPWDTLRVACLRFSSLSPEHISKTLDTAIATLLDAGIPLLSMNTTGSSVELIVPIEHEEALAAFARSNT